MYKSFFMTTDFAVKWQGTEEETTEKIIDNLIPKRLRAGMPVIIIIVGKSSSGKSAFGLLIQDIIYKNYGIDFATIVDKCVLIKPDDWVSKTEQIFFSDDPTWKQIRTLQMDEAKFLINSDDWQKQKNKAIRGITATSRTIKPLVFIIVAQLLKDVDAKTRETVDIIFEIKRSPGKKPVVVPKVLYEKRYDINKISIKPRRVQGIIEYDNGHYELVNSLVLRPRMPRKEVWNTYKSFEVPDKSHEIKQLFASLRDTQDKLTGESSKKIHEFSDWLSKNPEELHRFGKWNRKNSSWTFDPKGEISKYNYSREDKIKIENLVLKKIQKEDLRE